MRAPAVGVLLVIALAADAAAAQLDTVGDGAVTEASFVYDVRIDGVVATVTARQTLTAAGAGSTEAVYAFSLPGDAAIVGLTVTPPGGTASRGGAVDSLGAITPAADRDTVAMVPDLGLVWRLGALDAGGDVAYELRVYPVGGEQPTVVELTWVAPLSYVDGRLSLRIPDRGDGDNLTAEKGTVRVAAPTGVTRMKDLRAGGDLLAAKPGKKAWSFGAPRGDLVFDVVPVLGDRPVLTFTTARLGDDTGALAVAVLRPRADDAPARFAHAVFVIDASVSSAGTAEARDAIAALVDAVADDLRADATVQAVLFDRTTSTVLGAPAAPTDATRATIGDAIRAISGRSGTDVLAAIQDVGKMLRDRHAAGELGETLVVVVSDGLLPSDVGSAELIAALAQSPEDVTVSAVLVTPDALPLPDPRIGPLAGLAEAHGGHVIAVRHGEAAARADTIGGEVGAIADWYVEGLRAGDLELAMTLPDAIPAGGGVVGFGWYRGGEPRKLTLVASGVSRALGKGKIGRIAALADASGATPLLADDAVGNGTAERAYATLQRKLGVVGSYTALVAVDRGDELAVARLDLAARGGTFSRMPPPPEETIDVVTHPVAEIVGAGVTFIMDTAARIRVDLLHPQLMPAAKRCFTESLGKGGSKRGRVSLEIEIARGEVMMVRAKSATAGKDLLTCLQEASYALAVPTYTLTDGPDTIHLIRYPIDFAPSASTEVAVGADDGGPSEIDLDLVDLDSPLGGLEN